MPDAQQQATDGQTANQQAANQAAQATQTQASQGAAKFVWPEDWRVQMVGNDEKELKQVERYATPTEVWRKARALEQRLSSGELRVNVPFPEKGTEQEKTAWRQENGIPESPDKYDLTLKDGLVIGEEDKPFIEAFLQHAHGANYAQPQVNAVLEWYYDHKEQQAEQRYEKDKEILTSSEDELRKVWGQEYRGNVNRVHALFEMAPPGVKDRIVNARMEDGTPVMSDVDFVKFLVGLAREINPVTTLVPGAGANIVSAIDDEIAKIEKTMKENRKVYNADEKMQARYRELLEARDKAKSRAA